MPRVIDKMLLRWIAFRHFQRAEYQIAANFHVRQFIAAGSQRAVEQNRLSQAGGIVDPIAAFDDLYRLFRRAQFALVFLQHIHTDDLLSVSPEYSFVLLSDHTT